MSQLIADEWTVYDTADGLVTYRAHRLVKPNGSVWVWQPQWIDDSSGEGGQVVVAESHTSPTSTGAFVVSVHVHTYNTPDGWRNHITEKLDWLETRGWQRIPNEPNVIDMDDEEGR